MSFEPQLLNSKPKEEIARNVAEQESGENTPNEERESFFGYVENLGLSEDFLKNKKILDVGAGMRFFASYCLKNGINDEVYSLEPHLWHPYDSEEKAEQVLQKLWTKEIRQAIDDKTVFAVNEDMPFKEDSFDLILNHGAAPGHMYSFGEYGPEIKHKIIKDSFNEMLRVLRSGGEIRIFPIPNEADNWRQEWKQIFLEKVEELKADSNYEVSTEEVFLVENGMKKESKGHRLIIRKL